MQEPRPIPVTQTPVLQAQRRSERQAEAREPNRSAPVPLDDQDLDRVGGGVSAPNTTW